MSLLLHPQDGAELGIQDGDPVTAWNDLAEVEFKAVFTDQIARKTAAASGVYSSSITGQRFQVNALNHERLSDIGEATTLNDNTINIKRSTFEQYLYHLKNYVPCTRGEKFSSIVLIPLYFIVIGLFLQPINEIIPGIIRIVREPDVLITDYFAVGGIGAALINAGLTTLLSIRPSLIFRERRWTVIPLLPAV